MTASQEFLELVETYTTSDPGEQAMVQQTASLLQNHPDCYSASHYRPGHITGSAWILSPNSALVLLTHHRKLDRWFQLGGHLEFGEGPLEGATREAHEESGLTRVTLASRAIFDIDVHLIPARAGVPAHLHHDIRYQFIADPAEPLGVTAESRALAWVSLEEAARLNSDESLLRMIRKTRAARP